MKRKLVLFLTYLLVSIGLLTAQISRVTGVVKSADDGEPIIGATILVEGTSIGTVTDMDGKFEITNLPSSARTLLISFVGMVSQQVKIQAGQMTITLAGDNRILDEVIVVGYGTQRREAKTGSISTVTSEQIADIPALSVDKMLAGKMAGVQITAVSGQPGADSQIRIRGISSINASSEPLYVVDGIAVNSGNWSYFTNTGNAIASINPSDIESITVLKDAAAASIYGSRAANGVILITTKTGKEGKSRFTARAKFGFSKLANDNGFEMMSGPELLGYYRTALENAGKNPDDTYPMSLLDSPMTDYIDHFTRIGKQQEYEITATGGSQKTSYYNSLSYSKTDGIAYGIDFQRVQGRVNVDHELNKYLKTGARLNVGFSSANDVEMQGYYYINPLFAGLVVRPWSKPYNEDGSHALLSEISNSNPRLTAEHDQQWEKQYKFNGSMYLQWTPINGLTIRTNNAAEFTAAEGIRYWSAEANQGTATTQNSLGTYRTLTTSNTITYENKFFENHNYRILVGQEATQDRNIYNYTMASNVDPLMPFPQTAPSDGQSLTVDYSPYTVSLLSFFGVIDYNYAGKYYLQGSYRYDGSSLFGENNRWGSFWAIGASWNVHEESFMKDVDWLDLLKIRANYGVNGNNNIGTYKQYGTYEAASYNGASGLRPSNSANPDLGWEKNGAWNVGLDFNFLKRFSGSVDVYSRETSDMLLDRPVSYTSGFTSLWRNVGSIRNSGVEFQFDASIIDTKELQWNAGINLSHNKSKILDLDGDEMIADGDYSQLKHIQGEKLFSFYLRDYYGVNPTTGDALFVAEDGSLTSDISKARYYNAGSPEPTLTGGLNTDITWKGITLSVQFEGKFGNKILIAENNFFKSDGYRMTMNQVKSQLNYWKKPGDTNCNPRPIANNPTNSASSSTDRFLENGSYVRLKDITVSYNLPKKWLNPIGVQQVKVYASGLNVYTFHNVDFFDPERGVKGMGQGIYPMTKTFMIGLDVSF